MASTGRYKLVKAKKTRPKPKPRTSAKAVRDARAKSMYGKTKASRYKLPSTRPKK